MTKSIDRDISDQRDQSGGDVASLLMKIQRQLLFLERKIDRLTLQLQEKQYREDSSLDKKPYTPRPYSKSSSISGRVRSQRKERYRETSEEKGLDKAFYSKFRKTNGHPGSRKKPFQHKKRKRE